MEKKRTIALYPGEPLRGDVVALERGLKDKGESLSKALRPALRQLIRDHAEAVEAGHTALGTKSN